MVLTQIFFISVPGLNKICRKLNVDCASAIVGFDFHGGWSHPTYDGFVICKEYEDQVVAAWELVSRQLRIPLFCKSLYIRGTQDLDLQMLSVLLMLFGKSRSALARSVALGAHF